MAVWYRRKSWTKEDEKEFYAKLQCAREDGRAEYLKIQAIELIETNDKKLLTAAETLLNKILVEYPKDKLEKSSALGSLGDIYKHRKKYNKAIEYYQAAIDFEKKYPNVETDSYLSFSEFIVKTAKTSSFKFIESLLEKKLPDEFLPETKYKIYSLLSILNNKKGKTKKAKEYAEMAEQNANAETSGLRYHKYLGVVKERNIWLDKLVKGK